MISIANWNLNHATQRWRQAAICSKLLDINADIFILTETRDSISPGEHFNCVARSSPRYEIENGESWVSIWSRLPKVATHTTKDTDFTASATVALPDGTPLVVFGTVLPWRGQKWRKFPSAGAVAFEEALRVQQQDWQTLALEQNTALCIAGDFNQDLSETYYYWSLTAQQLLREALSNCGLIATTCDPIDPVRELTNGDAACIDHICLSQTLARRRVGKSRAWSPVVDGRTLSDHPGVWIELADGSTN